MQLFSRRKSSSIGRAATRRRTFETLEPRALLAANVMITEIMYHPQSENVRDEFIEIYNAEPAAVNLSGWRISDGVDYTFPLGTTVGAGQYLAVAADVARFEFNYPAVGNVVGGWSGSLSNGGETVELEDASGNRASRFTYSDEGDWATREVALGTPGGYDGWRWNAPHDGFGKSLELVNRSKSNDSGQNWAPSIPNGGTPGSVNSVNATNTAPLIRDMIHSPIVPRSTDTVAITARITDEPGASVNASVYWRVATTVAPPGPPFTQAAMFDDGLHGDGMAGDGVFGAVLPAHADRTIVEFYVRATDTSSNARTWPAAIDAAGSQDANALYQVDNAGVTNPALPDYRLIFTPWELNEFNTNVSRDSNAEMNITFVSVIDGVTEVRYSASVRYRGAGSRGVTPPNQRVNFVDDNKWNGVQAMNLNSRFPFLQHFGMLMFELAGLPTEHPERVSVRRNATTLPDSGSPQYGSYVHLEPINEDWAENHYPGDSNGNAYRGQGWNLGYIDNNPDSYRSGIEKKTNVSEDDYSDIIALGRAFNTSQTPNNQFVQRIEAAINVQEWLRWLAVNALLVNEENGLINGAGSNDEYTLYRGVNDTRFVIAVHDMDNILGKGDQNEYNPTRDLFEPARVAALDRLMNHANYRPYYFAHLKQLAEGLFSAAQINPLLDQELGGWVPASIISDMKSFAALRVANVLSQIPPGTPNLSSPQDTLRITEVMYNAAQGNDYDYIELKNTGPTTVNLQGVTIEGGITYTFPSVNLAPNQYIVVAANQAAFRARYGAAPNLAGEYSGNLNNSGEQILLRAGSPLFTTILDFTYFDLWQPSTDGAGHSLVIVNPAAATSSWNNGASWRASVQEGGSPGADDNELLGPNSVVINEVLSHTDLALGDRVELRNLTAQTVNLSNYYLSDDPAVRTKYRIPNGTTIAPGGYVAFTQSNHFGPPNTAGVPFGFSELGDEVYFTAANGITTIDSIDFAAAESEVSFGRFTTSTGNVDYPPMSTSTFGSANASPKIGPVVVNEIMYHPADSSPADTEYIELKNVSGGTVQLFDPSVPADTWAFTEGISYAFPSGITLAAGGFLILVPFDPVGDPTLAADFRSTHNVPPSVLLYGPYVGALDNGGEKLELSKPGPPEPDLFVPMIVVDRVTYDDVDPWALEPDGLGSSLSRKIPAAYANDPASWDSSRPNGSAGSENTFIDRTPPTAPSGLVVNTPQSGQFSLQWTAANDPDSGIGEYRIYRNGVAIAAVAATSYTDTAAAPRVRFDYQVSAVNAGGLEGPRSSVGNAGYGGIDAVWSLSDTQLIVQFTEPVNATTAAVQANYSLGGASVSSATPRADGRSVVLTTTPLAVDTPYTLQISNISVTSGSAFPPGTSFTYTHEPLSPGVTARVVNPFASILSMAEADVALALPNGHSSLVAASTKSYGRVNFVDALGGNAGHFPADAAFPDAVSTAAPLAVRATGIIDVATAATWTFGVTAHAAASGTRLRIDGGDVIAHVPGNAAADRFGSVALAAGPHFVDLVYYTNAGSAGVELFAAAGSFTTFVQTSTWRLLGDTSGGGLPLSSNPPAAVDLLWLAGAISGGMLTESAATTATADGGASLRYRATFAAGQSFSLLATPLSPAASVSLTLRRGSQIVATATSPGPGVAAWFDNVSILGDGVHIIEIATTATTAFDLRASLGGAFEGEAHGQGKNDDLASAQSIDAAVVAADNASRLAVAGSIVLPGVYEDLIAADNPVGYWRLNEPAGGSNVAVNSGSAGATVNGVYFGGTVLGQPPIVPNVSGTSASFDGSNDRVEMADSADINSAGPYANRTVELWFNAGDVTDRRMIFDEGNNQRGLNVYLDGGKLYVGAFNTLDDDGGATTPWGPIFLNTPVVADRTYHVALTLDGAARAVTAYLDGVAFGQSSAAGPLFAHTTGVRIGRRTDTLYHDGVATSSGHAFLGTIAEVAIYNATLSAGRIAEHYRAGAAKADDYYSLSLSAGQPTSIVVDAAVPGNWTIELQDAGGGVLAASTAGPANANASIRNFVADADGVYYVRIVSNVSSTYLAFVTRGAEFEREPNDSIATAHDISAAGAVWGGLETALSTDAFAVSVTVGQTLTIETATPDGLVGANGHIWNPRIELHAPVAGLVATDDNGAADGRNARIVYTASETGAYVVVVRAAAGSGDYLLTVDSAGGETAQLVDVVVASSDWSSEFLDLLAVRGFGQGGVSILASDPGAANFPWRDIDRIELVFDRPVSAAIGDLTVSGVAIASHAIASFESDGNSATWTLANAVSADRLTVDLSAALESALGGQSRQFEFSVLVGDVNDDDSVALDDVFADRALQFRSTTTSEYDPRHDVDGNGIINVVDMIHVRNGIGATLPSGAPSPAAAVVAAVRGAVGNSLRSATTPVLRAATRRLLASVAVDRLIVNAASTAADKRSLDSRSPRARRLTMFTDVAAGGRLLSRVNLDAGPAGDVS
ncbi:MAG: lamin tail domain-containing protein [Pirellulales bacterium]